jgi:hypothetical protein
VRTSPVVTGKRLGVSDVVDGRHKKITWAVATAASRRDLVSASDRLAFFVAPLAAASASLRRAANAASRAFFAKMSASAFAFAVSVFAFASAARAAFEQTQLWLVLLFLCQYQSFIIMACVQMVLRFSMVPSFASIRLANRSLYPGRFYTMLNSLPTGANLLLVQA